MKQLEKEQKLMMLRNESQNVSFSRLFLFETP